MFKEEQITNLEHLEDYKTMFAPTIEDIKTNIKVNNELINTSNDFIYDNAEKEGDFVFQYNCICKLLEYKRKTLLNSRGKLIIYLLLFYY